MSQTPQEILEEVMQIARFPEELKKRYHDKMNPALLRQVTELMKLFAPEAPSESYAPEDPATLLKRSCPKEREKV